MVVSNAEIKAKLKVIKIDKDTKEVITRKGIKFKIFNVDKNEYVCQTISYPTTVTICEYETDSNGILMTPYPLDSGKYKLEEVDQKIDGYLWNSESQVFEIGENAELITDNEYGILFETKFENQEVKGIINIHKTGEELVIDEGSFSYNEINLEGVKYNVYAKTDIYSATGKLKYKKDALVGTITTDKDGNGSISNLYLGNYYLVEVQSANNNMIDTKKYDVVLKYKDQYTANIDTKLDLKNYLPKGKLEFTKTDFSESKTLPNTTIEIYTENDELIYSGKTDSNGKIIIDELPANQKFYILEKEAPEGYKINEEKMYFEIKENGEVVKCSMKDEDITGTLEFTKVDISTDEPLPNTLIQIFDENDKLIYEGRTDENGMITIDKIKYGKYYILEKEAPEGYKLNPDKMWFEILEDGSVIKSVMKDEIIEVPNTGISDSKVMDVIVLICIIGGIGFIIYDKKRKK